MQRSRRATSPCNVGFRPRRSAHQALDQAREHIASGHRWRVDMDLEKFFDRVNHDVLMARLARRMEDKRILKLIRRMLLGWVSYYRKSEVRITFEQPDQWMRRKLRAILWRQWKRP